MTILDGMNPRCVVAIAAVVAGCSSSSPQAPERVPDQAEACARLSACTEFEEETFGGIVSGYDACMMGLAIDALSSNAASAVACVVAAHSCQEALRCIHIEEPIPCENTSPTCDGDLLRDCFSGVAVSRDCSAEGLTCVDNGNLTCGAQRSCTEDRCDGDRLFICVAAHQLEVAQDCEPGRCHVDQGRGRCLPSSETCERAAAYCDGDVAVRCSDGYEVRTLCLPGQCRETDGAFCASAEPCVSACEGSSLLACVGQGRRELIDCSQWGFSNCVDDHNGARCAHEG